ncbi:MAG: glycosyltransferase [Actinomycetota bacterium]
MTDTENIKNEELEKQPKKIKVLIFADSPACSTGFASVIKGIFTRLARSGRYDIDIFGINDRGGYKDPETHPYRIWPAAPLGETDVYGRLRFVEILRGADLDIKPSWDIIFTLQDPFIMEYPLPIIGQKLGLMRMIGDLMYKKYRENTPPKMWYRVISYWPVDSPLKGNWIEEAVSIPDYSVAYTKYGKEQIEKANNELVQPCKFKNDILTIPHGISQEDFYPVDTETRKTFRQKFFKNKVRQDTFIVGCVARNQMRKDLARVMKIFKEFQKRRPDSFLYIHARENDTFGSLRAIAQNFNLEFGTDWTVPGNFNENIGYPTEALNLLYNIMDCHVSSSLGEGWGLPINEAMATKVINLAPSHTSIPEIFNSEGLDLDNLDALKTDENIRGIPYKTNSTSSEWVCYGRDDFERVRPLGNVDDAVRKLIWIYDNPQEVAKITDRALAWVRTLDWDNVAKLWDTLFTGVYNDLEKERQEALAKDAGNKDTDKQNQPEQPEPERDESRPVQ